MGKGSWRGTGPLTLHLPPGFENGDIVRLDGLAGEADPGIKGNIYVRINIASLSEEEHAEWSKPR